MIEVYIPNSPDTSLDVNEYYYKYYTMKGPRIIRVFALDIMPMKDGTEYGIYQLRGSKLFRIDGRGDDNPCRGIRKGELYDNYRDCQDGTHNCYDYWEELRGLTL